MSDFSFSAPECDRCGAFLDSSDADCSECSADDLRRFHFEAISGDSVETIWAIDGVRAWHVLAESVDDPLEWRCVETGSTALTLAQMGIDVRSDGDEQNT